MAADVAGGDAGAAAQDLRVLARGCSSWVIVAVVVQELLLKWLGSSLSAFCRRPYTLKPKPVAEIEPFTLKPSLSPQPLFGLKVLTRSSLASSATTGPLSLTRPCNKIAPL